MLSIQNRLQAIKTALTSVQGAKVYHYTKPAETKAPYVVWAEETGDTFGADNRRGEYSIQGTIDIYSKEEFDSLFDDIPNALDGVASCRLNSIQYEDETKLIHYEYYFWC